MAEENEVEDDDNVNTDDQGGEEENTSEGETDAAGAEESEDEEGSDEGKAKDGDAGGEGKQAGDAKSRRDKRIETLARERDEAKERAIRAETLAEERAQGRQDNVSTADAKRIRDEKLALLDPAERREFLRDEEMAQMKHTVLLTQLQTQDQIDRNSYATAARNNTVYAKHSAEVEKRLAVERQQGRNWGRETILAQIIGEAALKAKPDTKKKEEAKQRVNESKSKSLSGRSNTEGYRPARGGESFDDLERRLENVTF